MGDCSSTSHCNPCGPEFNAINQLASKAAVYARQASTYATNAENSWLEFNSLYLGAFSTPPTQDNEGNPLQVGALYWNSASDQLFTWNGSVWVTTNFNEFTQFLSTGTTEPRNLVTRFSEIVNVKDYGAVGDGINDDTAFFNLAATAANSVKASVYIPKGNYNITAPTISSNWILDSGAQIIGLPNQPSSPGQFASLNDTSRLTGNAFDFNASVLGSNFKPIVKIGTTDPWLAKNWKYVGENVASLVVSDDRGRPAAKFSTLVSNISQPSIGHSIGLTTVNTDTRPNGAWGIYAENIRANNAGNMIGCEIDIINLGSVEEVSPYSSLIQGITPSLWLSCGGGTSQPLGNTGNDASVAIGIVRNQKQFGRGIVFRQNSINTIGNFGSQIDEAIAMPDEYGIAWHTASTTTSTLNAYTHSRARATTTKSQSVSDLSFKLNPAGSTEATDVLYRHQYFSNNGTSQLGAEHIVLQMENFVGTDARVAHQFTAKNQGSGYSGVKINFESQLSFTPLGDDTHILGHPSARWKEIYCTNNIINTSDSRQKQQVRDINESEKKVATKLKTLIKAFKFNDAVTTKGEENARWHIGAIAQEIKEAFESEGLNAENYGMFCYDQWEENVEKQDENNETISYQKEKRDSYGIRYQEMFAFIIANI